MVAYIWRLKTEYVNPDALIHDSFMLTWAAKWEDSSKVHRGRLTSAEALAKDDARIVGKLAELVGKADAIVAHNGDSFDSKRLNQRLLVNDLPALSPVRTIDTLKLVRKHLAFPSNRLDYVARALGGEGKNKTGFDLWKRAYQGDTSALREMDEYCQKDVVELEEVFQKVRPFVKLPRLIDAGPEDGPVCTGCGSERLHRDGEYHTNASVFQKWRCADCGKTDRTRSAEKALRPELVPVT